MPMLSSHLHHIYITSIITSTSHMPMLSYICRRKRHFLIQIFNFLQQKPKNESDLRNFQMNSGHWIEIPCFSKRDRIIVHIIPPLIPRPLDETDTHTLRYRSLFVLTVRGSYANIVLSQTKILLIRTWYFRAGSEKQWIFRPGFGRVPLKFQRWKHVFLCGLTVLFRQACKYSQRAFIQLGVVAFAFSFSANYVSARILLPFFF